MRSVGIPAGTVLLGSAALAQPSPGIAGVLVGDTELDAVYIARDLNGNGHANDPGEAQVYFDASNASGLPSPTGEVLGVTWANGFVFVCDDDSDSVYRLRDFNGDGDAQDPFEAAVWLSDRGNILGHPLPRPTGAAVLRHDEVYILGAGTQPAPFAAIYRTRDLNADGDAQDAGEADLWFDIARLIPGCAPYDVDILEDWRRRVTLYFTAERPGAPAAVWQASDANGSGRIDPGEFSVLIDDSNGFGAPVSYPIGADLWHLYVGEGDPLAGVQSVWRLEGPPVRVWDETLIPPPGPVVFGACFSLDATTFVPLHMVLTSAGSEREDNILLLRDLDQDSRFTSAGETVLYVTGSGPGAFPETARCVTAINSGCYPDCDQSTGVGILDIFDFLCFQNRLAARDPYACCCDTAPGCSICDIFDWLCFQNLFARGCH